MTTALRLSHSLVRSHDPLVKSSVVICHGLFGSKQNWKSFSHAFAQRSCGSVVTADLRNHGVSPHSDDMDYISMSKDVTKLIEDLKLTDTCAIGHSMGGKVVMCAALEEPKKISKLVVIDSSPTFSSSAQQIIPYVNLMLSTDLFRIERECDGSLAGMRQLLMEEWKEAVPNSQWPMRSTQVRRPGGLLIRFVHDAELSQPLGKEETMRLFLLTNLEQEKTGFNWRVNLKAIQSCWHHIIGFPQDELKSKTFDGPTLFLAGGRSNYLGSSDLPILRQYFPQARLFRINNAGHWVHVDQPQAVLDLITAFAKNSDLPQLDNVDELDLHRPIK